MTEFEVIEGGSPSVCVAIFDVGEIDRNIDVKIFIEPGDVAGNANIGNTIIHGLATFSLTSVVAS